MLKIPRGIKSDTKAKAVTLYSMEAFGGEEV
jgi:hypothetical protein